MFETIPTVPTAEEVLDRSLSRASKRMEKRQNRDRANADFVQSVYQSVHDRLVEVVASFPEFDEVPVFYRDTAGILFGLDRIRKSLGAVGWAARWARDHGPGFTYQTKRSPSTAQMRRRYVARLASVVHQVDQDLRFLNEVRNTLRTLPHIEDCFTVVVAGYPNVGKSSFIRRVSTGVPEVASYPFTTKGVLVGHRFDRGDRIQFVDTPGILDRPAIERNAIEQQAVAAITSLADMVLFLIDGSEQCGYPLEAQLQLLIEVQGMKDVPVVPVVSKADVATIEGYPSFSAETGEHIEDVLTAIYDLKALQDERDQAIRDEEADDCPTIERREASLGLALHNHSEEDYKADE